VAKIDNIINSLESECKTLGKKDVVVISAGANDIYNQKDTGKEVIHKMTQFWQSHSNTNIVTVGIPHRHDLVKDSRINRVIREFNNRLVDKVKRFNHVSLIQVAGDRRNYTTHGLHFNKKGKEGLAKKVAKQIIKLTNKGQVTEAPRKDSIVTVISDQVTPEPNTCSSVEAYNGSGTDVSGNPVVDSNELNTLENKACIESDLPEQLEENFKSQELDRENGDTGTNSSEQLVTDQQSDSREEECGKTVIRRSSRQKKPSKNMYDDFYGYR
jgi:hypothetical protein